MSGFDISTVGGSCDARFSAVRDAFVANFIERGELGAAVCVSVDGRVVVDLWAGWAKPAAREAWAAGTLVNAFSVGKGFTAVCAHRLVERGLIDLDTPIATYWPRFSAEGKGGITMRHVLSHQSALPAVRERMPEGSMLQWDRMVAALERTPPWWEPGEGHGYHVNTFGFLVGEVVRRLTGDTIGTMLRTEVAGPLDADVHLGLPRAQHRRVAEFQWPAAGGPPPLPENVSDAQLMNIYAYWNPPGISGGGYVNTPAWREAEIPSTNTHASARGVARIYSALAAGGTIDGVEVLGRDTLARAVVEQSYGDDLVLGRPSRFALGFQLTQPERPLGPNTGAFGHFGAGGSLGFCDPEASIGFGYVMNTLGPRWQNPRNAALIDAVYASL